MQLKLVDIALRGHVLAMKDDFFPVVADWSEYRIEMKAGVRSCTLLPKENDRTLVRYIVSTGLRWTLASDEKNVAASVEADYGLVFVAPESFDIEAQGAETLRQVVLTAWPYWRQDFLQMATKASLPQVAIPTRPDFESEIF
ncbi:hypothetical protein S7S_10500 [Isoalcanivorax pacificus W11-5]|uniref:Preprotein translocase subunit SecB n=1 Tax=Isoalcanivorax pacificus W11-5 TaxID=391936 RepID=A0A0B4XQK3_9GAMM|nr:hypothetical protein [Isoalcanivorax pacificus]AJD48512.1 hypothetical protein S7S_10500 [Isoalcanivorax pacificus W11-5]